MKNIQIGIDSIATTILPIGFQGENDYTQVTIYWTPIYSNYPDAVATMVVKSPAGELYPKEITQTGNRIIWNVTASDCVSAGSGQYQLTFTNGEQVIKTYIGNFTVRDSIIADGEAPDPVEDWLEDANAALAEIGGINSISASATTLEPGSAATAEITTVDGHKNIAIGVPKGEKGDKGEDGDPAPAEDVTAAVDAYLEENFTNPSNPPLDRSLLSSSSAAPADLVGDLKSALTLYTNNSEIQYETKTYYNITSTTVSKATSASASVRGAKVACVPGQKFTIQGIFSGYRVYGWTDSDNSLIERSGSNVNFPNYTVITAPPDAAWLYLNDEHGSRSFVGDFLTARVSYLEALSQRIESKYSKSFTKPSSGNYVSNTKYHFDTSKTYYFVWYATDPNNSTMNLYTRETSSGSNTETIAENLVSNKIVSFTPTVEAEYVRIVANESGTLDIYVDGMLDYEILRIDSTIDKILKGVNPFVRFEYSHNMLDVSDSVSQMDYSTEAARKTTIDQVYTLFDALATDYPGYVTKYDAASVLSLSYPQYANGIEEAYTETRTIDYDSQGDPITKVITYNVTPAYKVNLYKLSCGSNALAANKKKKLLLIAGLHGNEVCAPFNAYLLAKHLCDPTADADIMKLRSAYNIYIVPYLNGYGCYHKTRCNANRVDINRNFPTSGWTIRGVDTIDSDGLCVYRGLEAGSEFETKIVMGLYNQIKPDVFIDHHNSGTGSSQFYSVVTNTQIANSVYQSLTDCAFAFIKNYPNYFGTDYNLFSASDVSPQTLTGSNGDSDRWAYEQGCISSGTVEIMESINFLNGSTSVQNRFGADTFSVGEYTLQNMVLHMCDFEMNRYK